MNPLRAGFRQVLWAVFLIALVAALAFTIRNFLNNQPGIPAAQVSSTPAETPPGALATPLPGEAYPPPGGTPEETPFIPPPADTVIAVGTGEVFPPTETPWPTFTPYPSPTERSGPKDTPIPLIAPAKDAAGEILFLSRNENTILLNLIPIDQAGDPLSGRNTFPIDNFSLSEGIVTVYPSPDGSLLAVVNGWGVGGVIDTSARTFEPFLNGNIGRFLNWFPDNRRVLIWHYSDNGLWLYNVDVDERVPLSVTGYGNIVSAAASPDGKYVIYSRINDMSSPSEVWLVGADGRDERKLFNFPGGDSFAWSPDGKKIAFFGEGWTVMDADGSNPRTLGSFPTGYCYFTTPTWSPDSKTLAVVTSTVSSTCRWWDEIVFQGADILLIDVESGEARPLTPDGMLGNIDPAWSPDGKKIAFVSNRSGSPELWVVNADGTDLRQLTSNGQYLRYPVWRRP